MSDRRDDDDGDQPKRSALEAAIWHIADLISQLTTGPPTRASPTSTASARDPQPCNDGHDAAVSSLAVSAASGTWLPPLYIGASLALTGLAAWLVYHGRRRFPTIDYIPPSWIQQHRPLRGRAVRIGDSDNFRMYHIPPLWFKAVPNLSREYSKQTIHIRLAGVDAPESAYFSMPSQPFSAEAKEWLTRTLLNRRVTVVPYSRDRYNRLLAMVYVRRWLFFKRNVSLMMVKAGYATIYQQSGAEYGGILEQLKRAEQRAKAKGIGMWSQNMRKYKSPAEHKRKHLQDGE